MATTPAPEDKGLLSEILQKLVYWLRGKFWLGLIMGVLSYIGLRLIGVEYALGLGIFTGIMDLIPVFGPLVSMFVVVGFALYTGSFWNAGFVFLLYCVLQLAEGFYIEPKIMQKSVGLNPWLVLIALLLGSQLFGFFGVLLAVPAIIVLTVLYNRLNK